MPIKLKKKIIIRLSGLLLCLIISFPILKTAWVYFENTNQVEVDQSSVIRPHDVARIVSDRFSTKRLYQTKGYNSVSIKHIFQHLTIAGNHPPAGLFFNYNLNSEEKFSIEVDGKALQGTTTMRIRNNEESPQYFAAPDGIREILVSNTDALELLFYSDNVFSYQLNSIQIRPLAQNEKIYSDDDLKSAILNDIPDLQTKLQNDRFEAARALLNWAANISDFALSHDIALRTTHGIGNQSAADIYFRFFLPDKGAVICGGAAVFFDKVARLFDFDSFTIDFGDQRDGLTHVTTVIAFEKGNLLGYYIFDPTFNMIFYLNGNPATITELINAVRKQDYSGLQINEMSLVNREYIALKKDLSKCEQLLEETEQFLICSRNFGIHQYMQTYQNALIKNNYSPEVPAGYLELLVQRIYHLGVATDTNISQQFSKKMTKFNIPVGAP